MTYTPAPPPSPPPPHPPAPPSLSVEDAHLEWEPDRFFWAVVEAPAWTGPLPRGLVGTLESEAPVPVDQLHAVCAPGDPGMLVVCAARTSHLAALPPSVLSLTPSRAPPWLTSAPARLNLLVGRFEPQLIRRARSRTHLVAAAAVLACAAIGSWGLMRRAEFREARAASAQEATASLIAPVIGPDGGLDQLTLEVSRSRREAGAAARAQPAPEASPTLAAILRAWPAQPARTQSISIGPQGVAIEAAIEGDAAEFLKGFSAPAGWVLDEPRLVRIDQVTRVSLRLRQEPTPP